MAAHIALIEAMSVSKLLSDTHPCSVLFCYKVRVSSILDSPLGKATVKAASITDSDEECGCRQGLLQQGQVRGSGGEVGGAGLKREICFLDPIMI